MSTYNSINISDFVLDQMFGYQDQNDTINQILYIIERYAIDHTESTGIHNANKLSKRVSKIKFAYGSGYTSASITQVFNKNMSLRTGTGVGNPSTGKFVFDLSGGNSDTNGYNEAGFVFPCSGTSSDGDVNRVLGLYNSGDTLEANKDTMCTASIFEMPSATWSLTQMDFFIVIFASTTVTA